MKRESAIARQTREAVAWIERRIPELSFNDLMGIGLTIRWQLRRHNTDEKRLEIARRAVERYEQRLAADRKKRE